MERRIIAHACYLTSWGIIKNGRIRIRINLELLIHAHLFLRSWLILLGAIQIVYASLASMSQRNLKKRIAYSSISHMGFVAIGIGSLTDAGINGAILQMISHGLIGEALFFFTLYNALNPHIIVHMRGSKP